MVLISQIVSFFFQRYGHTVVSHGKKIYLFGGRNDNHSCNRLYCFDTDKHIWSCPKVCGYIPTARYDYYLINLVKFLTVFFTLFIVMDTVPAWSTRPCMSLGAMMTLPKMITPDLHKFSDCKYLSLKP